MEENNKEKKKLLLVIAIFAVLMVLSVGGVYAYFSARATNSGSEITGQTLDIGGTTLSISAQRVTMNPTTTPVSDNLVPAVYGASPTEITTTEVNRALSRQCSLDGYTGCHVWKITASTTQTVASVNIRLNLRVNDIPSQSGGAGGISNSFDTDNVVASPLDFSGNIKYESKLLAAGEAQPAEKDKSQWSYVVYTGTDSSATTILNKGQILNDFPDSDTTIDIHSGAGLTANTPAIYYVMVYLNNTNSTQNAIYETEGIDATGIYNGSVILEAMGGEVKVNFLDNAAEYITNLYTNATKSTATVNNITYNLAPSVGLMNDRHASMSTDINGGDIRYYGANPNNYVWLGDSYTSDYTIPGNVTLGEYTDREACIQDDNSAAYCTEDIVRHTGDKKLWRVIGVFGGKVKLVSVDPISTQGLSWDTSANAYGGNSGYGINQWGSSGSYEGSDLMRLLNEGYTGTNGSLYWNKTAGTVYTDYNNTTTANVSFANTGLSVSEKALIDTATWYTGANSVDNPYVDAQYIAERGNMGGQASCTRRTNLCNDTVTRTNAWNGKVGLIYASDYGYAVNLVQCNQTMNNYWEDACWNNNWLKPSSKYSWTMSPHAGSDVASKVFYAHSDGYFGSGTASDDGWVLPAVFLKSGVVINGGTGTEANPYVLSY